MVWYLQSKQNGKKSIFLLTNKKYKIGRLIQTGPSEIDIPIDSDQTVSRLHAELLIKFDESSSNDLDLLPNIVLTDNSKFGTFINDSKIDGFKSIKKNDIIRFGAYNSIYQLIHEPLIVTTSCLSSSNKQIVKKLVTKLGGHLINDWINECTLVVMDSITVTVKVIDALICQRRIVNKRFLEVLVESSEKRSTPPEPKDYLPTIAENDLNTELINFDPNPIRKSLFKEVKFVFLKDNQLQKFQNIVELASGECELYCKSQHMNKPNVIKSNFLFIRNDDDDVNQIQSSLESFLDTIDQKLIEESEIGLAVLYSNLNEYCNAKKSKQSESNNLKVSSQTLTDTYFKNNYTDYDTQKSEIMTCDTQDSVMFQFENRVQDLFIVSDTPEQVRKRPLEEINEDKEASFVAPTKKTQLKSQIEDFDILKDDFSFKVEPKKVVKVKEIQVKKEPRVIKIENKTFNESKFNRSGLVYSKNKPPSESFVTVQQNESIMQPSINVKVKYESLIKREPQVYTNKSTMDGKKNFKKFRKVPKASQIVKNDENRFVEKKIKNEPNKSLFKSFKEEPFDLNSQFEMFMSSNK